MPTKKYFFEGEEFASFHELILSKSTEPGFKSAFGNLITEVGLNKLG